MEGMGLTPISHLCLLTAPCVETSTGFCILIMITTTFYALEWDGIYTEVFL